MQKAPQILVKLRKADHVVFDVSGHDDFVRLVKSVSSYWGKWLCIGHSSLVRKDDIESIYYLKDGWNAQSGQSSMH